MKGNTGKKKKLQQAENGWKKLLTEAFGSRSIDGRWKQKKIQWYHKEARTKHELISKAQSTNEYESWIQEEPWKIYWYRQGYPSSCLEKRRSLKKKD